LEEVLRYKKLDGVPEALAALGGGREDRIIPLAHAEALASRLPVHILEQTGHLPHMEKAGEVNRLIKRLIENQA
jgi:pyruvate dehydrogenase E2 component (dihydrolipoamide acetyltransferase)